MCPRKNRRIGSCVCKALNQHCVQSCPCNRCVTLSLGFAKDWFANNSSRYFRALNVIRQTISQTLRISLASKVKLNKALFMLD